MMFDPLQSGRSNVQWGKLRAIAVSSRTRPSILPDVPTIEESHFCIRIDRVVGCVCTCGIVARPYEDFLGEIEQIVKDASFRSKLEPLGLVPTLLTGDAFAAFQLAELAKWGKAVQVFGSEGR